MRTYGLVVADNGSSGFIGGVPDERWDNDALRQLQRVTLADFEAVDTARLRISPASAAARGAGGAAPGARPGGAAAGPARRARPGVGAAAALLAGVGRRSLTAEPRVPADLRGLGDLTAATSPSPAGPRAAGGPGDGGLLPEVLAGLLGLVAAALAMRQLGRSRRRPPPGRHARSGTPPDRDRDRAQDPDPAARRR
jgi:hypothetical protein